MFLREDVAIVQRSRPLATGISVESFDPSQASEHLNVALEAARIAAEISRSYYSGNFTVSSKADHTPVTQADVECEEAILDTILKRFP